MEDLETLAAAGDAKALTELFERMESAETEEDAEAAALAFDRVAFEYAFGDGTEWQSFLSIARRFLDLQSFEDEAITSENYVRDFQFELTVLVKLVESGAAGDRAAEELAATKEALELAQQSVLEARAEMEFCAFWIDAAKGCLESDRFIELGDDVLNELIETVAYEVDGEEDEEGEECDGCEDCEGECEDCGGECDGGCEDCEEDGEEECGDCGKKITE